MILNKWAIRAQAKRSPDNTVIVINDPNASGSLVLPVEVSE